MSDSRRPLLINLTLLIVSCSLSLLLAEALFYRYFPQPTYAVKFCPWGFEHIPNITFKHTPESKESISYIRYNSEGFRGTEEYVLPKPERILRVAILGDSYGEGAEVDYQYLHATVLERLLNQYRENINGGYKRVEVIKAGVYGYDSCQELRLFQNRVLKYRPDIVFLIYTGELKENTNFCRLEGNTLEYVDMKYSRWQYVKRYLMGYLKAKSHLLNYLYRVYRHHLGGHIHLPEQLNRTFSYEPPDSREFMETKNIPNRPIGDYMRISKEQIQTNLPSSYDHRLLFAIFKQLDHLVKNYGGKLYVIFSHNKPENFALGHYLEKEHIGYIDIFSYINDHRTKSAHFQLDGHWNEYGHYLVGKGLFELISKKNEQNATANKRPNQ